MKKKTKKFVAYVLVAVLLSGMLGSQETWVMKSLAASPTETSAEAPADALTETTAETSDSTPEETLGDTSDGESEEEPEDTSGDALEGATVDGTEEEPTETTEETGETSEETTEEVTEEPTEETTEETLDGTLEETTGEETDLTDEEQETTSPEEDEGKIVISESTFPDAAMHMFAHSCDTDGDDKLSQAEIEQVKILVLPSNEIADLTGVGYFENLENVDVSYNKISDFSPLAELKQLKKLKVRGNPAETLDLTGCSSLTRLYAEHSNFTEIKIAGLTQLEKVRAGGNKLTALDISGCTNLLYLTCHGNAIKELDVTGATKLLVLEADGNGMTSLKVEGLRSLIMLHCQNNELASLNLTGLSNLQELDASDNKLVSLDLSGLEGLTRVFASGNQLEGSIDLGRNVEKASFENNKLTKVSAGSRLKYLNCRWNNLSELSIAEAAPEQLYVTGNQLKSLSIHTDNLESLHCADNNLFYVDAGNALDVELSPQSVSLVRKVNGTNHWTELAEIFSRKQLERIQVDPGESVANVDKQTGIITYTGAAEQFEYDFIAGTMGEGGTNALMRVKVSLTEEKVETDFSKLNSKIAEYASLEQGEYSNESWEAFQKALNDAKAVAANTNATQTEVDAAFKALVDARLGLRKEGEITDFTQLNGLLAKYQAIWEQGQGDYTNISWNEFEDAWNNAQAVAANTNATQAQVDAAIERLEAAYTGLDAPNPGPNPGPGGNVDKTALQELVDRCEGDKFVGCTEESRNAFEAALKAAKETLIKENVTQKEIDDAKARLEAAYKGLVKGIWAEWTDDWKEQLGDERTITYTGKAIKPTVKVYHGGDELTSKSYSVSYKNNTKVGTAEVIIKTKGNYVGSCTMNFNIEPVDLGNDSNISIPNLYVPAAKNGGKVSVKPAVTWNGKKVNAKMYEVILPDNDREGAYAAPGTYDVKVKAKENNGIYTGEKDIKITVVNTGNVKDEGALVQVLMSSVKVKFNFKSKPWQEGGVTLGAEDIKVTYKNKTLVLGEDFTLHYDKNDKIGTATVILTGTNQTTERGSFVGELKKTFKITGTAIKAKDVTLGTTSFEYDGNGKEPEVTVKAGEKTLVKSDDGITGDYTVRWQNNMNAGKKATVVVTGINGYSGTVKKTFTINAYDITGDKVEAEIMDSKAEPTDSVPYEKGGSKPAVKVRFDGKELALGKDYTVSYSKNTKVTEGATAEIKIKGKGNFKGTKVVNFAITTQDIEKLKATAADQTSVSKWNKVNPVITDTNGKALKKGTDYEKVLEYELYDADGNKIEDTTATPPAVGMTVKVTAHGKGAYTGSIEACFRIIDSKKSIAKAKATIKPQTYTKGEIELQKGDIKLEIKEDGTWKEIQDDKYEIIGYSNNINKGKKAKVTIHGLEPYGGTKTFTFEIKAHPIEEMDWLGKATLLFLP